MVFYLLLFILSACMTRNPLCTVFIPNFCFLVYMNYTILHASAYGFRLIDVLDWIREHDFLPWGSCKDEKVSTCSILLRLAENEVSTEHFGRNGKASTCSGWPRFDIQPFVLWYPFSLLLTFHFTRCDFIDAFFGLWSDADLTAMDFLVNWSMFNSLPLLNFLSYKRH